MDLEAIAFMLSLSLPLFILFFAFPCLNHYCPLNFTIWSPSCTQLIIWLGGGVFPSVPFIINLYVNKISCILCLNNVHAIHMWMASNDLQNTHIARIHTIWSVATGQCMHNTHIWSEREEIIAWMARCMRTIPHQHSRTRKQDVLIILSVSAFWSP